MSKELTIILIVLMVLCLVLSIINAVQLSAFKAEVESTFRDYEADMRVIKEEFANLAYRIDVLEGRYG